MFLCKSIGTCVFEVSMQHQQQLKPAVWCLWETTVEWTAAGLGRAERGADSAGQGTWSRLQSERRSSLFSASIRRWYSVRDTTWQYKDRNRWNIKLCQIYRWSCEGKDDLGRNQMCTEWCNSSKLITAPFIKREMSEETNCNKGLRPRLPCNQILSHFACLCNMFNIASIRCFGYLKSSPRPKDGNNTAAESKLQNR